MDKQLEKNPIDGIILDIVREQKPQTTVQLVKVSLEKTGLNEQEIAALIIRLENEGKLQFTAKEAIIEANSEFVVFSKNTEWFWITLALAVAAVAVVLVVPVDLYPVFYVRQILSLIFLLFLPGYTFVRLLFLRSVPFKTGSENLDKIERVALSLGLSLVLTFIVGLVLYYIPLSLGLVPISLLVLTVIFGSAAVGREYQSNKKSGAGPLATTL